MLRIDLKRVYLRNFMFCDLLDVHHYSINPNIGPNAGWAPHRNIEETRSVLLEFTRNRDLFAIIDKTSNRCIGQIGLHKDYKRDDPNCKMIGYVLDEPYWGKGIMSEVVQGLISYVFTNSSITLLSIYHYPFNNRSRRVIEKCGFKFEGILRNGSYLYNGMIVDDYCYSLKKEEWYSG